jgi:hypothetical protein
LALASQAKAVPKGDLHPMAKMTFRAYRAKFAEKVLSISTFEMPDGKIEQFLVSVGS